ncbi:uncharacterized protein LOC118463750 [Anopheles albimanus]|uniref:Uncharacterized protein n=1 Tax=Anopheles albimanus TaxID=7167 RepID=A0A182FIE2_ANOAL|nr:uncharacterized protein LOC118463750 [Anopheles albimanus]
MGLSPLWLLLLLLSTSGWAAPLAGRTASQPDTTDGERFVAIGRAGADAPEQGTASVVTIGRCAAPNERLLHVENLTIVKSQTTTLSGTLEIHIDPRFAVSCVLARPKTPSSRAALHGYRFPRSGCNCVEIHVQEHQQQPVGTGESSLDYQLLVYGVRRPRGGAAAAATAATAADPPSHG